VKTLIRNTLNQYYYAPTQDQEEAATRAFNADPTLASVSPDRPIVWHKTRDTLNAALYPSGKLTSLGTPVRVLAVNACTPTTEGGSQYSQISGNAGQTERSPVTATTYEAS
jgi:hypothetical protein